MLLYNLGTVGVLGAAGRSKLQTGVALWPALIVHVVMTIWCVATLVQKSVAKADKSPHCQHDFILVRGQW